MFTLPKSLGPDSITIMPGEKSTDELLGVEWLLTNNRGGFCSSTSLNINTRKYHGLLTGSLTPPVNRVMCLSNCVETIHSGGGEFSLGGYEFEGGFSPASIRPTCVRKDIGIHFDYELSDVDMTRSIYLNRDADEVFVVYNFTRIWGGVGFTLRPFVGLRDFHSVQNSDEELYFERRPDGIKVGTNGAGEAELVLRNSAMQFSGDSQWWYKMMYRKERERGEGCFEDLWSPGKYYCVVDSPCQIIFKASMQRQSGEGMGDFHFLTGNELASVKNRLGNAKEEILSRCKFKDDGEYRKLFAAADQFVVEVQRGQESRVTILAGYPWFADWGRDALISLPGLLLSTGRYDEAKSVLMNMAETASGGMVANFFDDYNNTGSFNSIDASLWFVAASFKYLQASGDNVCFDEHLLPAIRWIVDSYLHGTNFGIRVDHDGLVTGGDANTQLTWMDARCNGVSFTPRYGKAVEINALWYNAVCSLAGYYADRNYEVRNYYNELAERCAESFKCLFWNEGKGYLNDCVFPDGGVDASLRPNQIFAVSLDHSPLEDYQRKAVVAAVENNLLTGYGLRSLDVHDEHYKGTYCGARFERDGAYHNGTVWGYLMGPFVEAYLKVNGFSDESRERAKVYIEPLLDHMNSAGCVGQVSEIFDGDEPHAARGCFAQAWSVAELLRAYELIKGDG